ncbi:hypothetical protein BDA96_08G038300 [Sorghum bicolor]|uniref:RING-type domain-containing protein n=1 Tax=Sorghum bicolor TaxID=4558 RepID=A0A921QE57_SORBI|nr:hypothetical protein BDA96_08G038300 [Sorghum bicolor]
MVLLMEQDQLSLAELLVSLTIQVPPPSTHRRQFHDAMRLLSDVDTRGVSFHEQQQEEEAGYDERMLSEALARIVLRAAEQAAGLVVVPPDDDETTQQPYYPNGGGSSGAVVVPASAAAVRTLEKQTFHAAGGGSDESVASGGCGITECSICFDEFVDGAQVTVLPCPSRGHRFHPDCIAKWLGISNMCPLCRHELPTLSSLYDQ